jgi:mono/diheme cytochrome c family protein
MHKHQHRFVLAAGVILGLGVGSTALGLPWDLDMADSQAKDGYSIEMAAPAEGVVAQPNILSPMAFRPQLEQAAGGQDTPEINALANPLEADEATLANGERMYDVYCTPCHGDGQNLGPVAAPGRYPGVAVLAGNAGVLALRSDGSLYTTVTQGRRVMPAYGWAMDDNEIWSLVHYLRTMPGATYEPPAPAPVEAPVAEEEEAAE